MAFTDPLGTKGAKRHLRRLRQKRLHLTKEWEISALSKRQVEIVWNTESTDNFNVNANVNNLFYFLIVLHWYFKCYDFKQAIYPITLTSHLAILLNNLTENVVFLVVRVLPDALLRQSMKSPAPYHAALGYSWRPVVPNVLVHNGVGQRPKRTLCSHRGIKRKKSLLSLSAGTIGDCWNTEKKPYISLQVYLTVLRCFTYPPSFCTNIL